MQAVKQAILARFPKGVEVAGAPTPDVSGKLEVQVVDGPTLHSKANGDGFVDKPEKIEAILNGIAEHALKTGQTVETSKTDTSSFTGGSGGDETMLLISGVILIALVMYAVPHLLGA